MVITHHLGARDQPGAHRIATTAIAVNSWIGLAVSAAVYLFAAPLLRLMQLPESLMQYALPFLTMMGGTLFMEAMNTAIGAVLRAHAHTRDAMIVTVGQNLLNAAGNCVMLFGLFGCPKMGVTGVALSSVCSRVAASIALWLLLDRRIKLRLFWRDFLVLPLERLRRILHIGLPAAGENICYWTALMVVTSFTARLGAESLAIQTYTQQVQRLVVLFSFSLGLATEILIGRMIGAGAFDEAYHALLKSLRTGVLVATGAILIVAAVAPQLLGIFTKDPVILAGGTLLLRMAILIEPGRVFNIVVISSLRATGDARFPLKMGVLSMWFIWVPLAWLLALKLHWGLPGIWISMTVDEWFRGLTMYWRWKKRRWLKYAQASRDKVAGEMLPQVTEA